MEAQIGMSIGILICVMLSAFFSASETAFTTVSRIRLKSMAQSGHAKAAKTLALSDNYDKLLSTILIGNNVVNIVAASMGTLLFTSLIGEGAGVPVSSAVITVVVLIFGEISPKSLAKENAEHFAFAVTPFLRALVFLFSPLNFLFSQWKRLINRLFKKGGKTQMTQAELKTIVDEAQNEGSLDDESGALIRSAIEFDDVDVADILTPRVDVITVSSNMPMEEVARTFAENAYSRLPVCGESVDDIIGVIHEKDFFCGLYQGMKTMESMIHKVCYISPTMKVSDLLRLLQQSKTQLAVVVDEFGGTDGIVTMEDVLEELVGDIWDEHDVVVDYFRPLDHGGFLVDGRADLEDMFERFAMPQELEYDCVTVSGWVMEQLGRIPAAGDCFSYGGFQITVTKATSHHAVQVRIEPYAEEIEEH